MEQTQRTRLIMLAVAGLLFGGGVYGWVWYNNQKAQDTEIEAVTPTTRAHLPIRRKLDPLASASSGPMRGQMTSNLTQGATTVPIGATAAANRRHALDTASGAQAGNKLSPTTASAVPANGPQNQLAAKGSQNQPLPVSAVKPSAILSKSTPVAQAARPEPAKQVQSPVAAATTLIPHKAPQPSLTPPVAVTPPAITPAAASASTEVATTADKAASESKLHVGRVDPTQPITAYLPFPRGKKATTELASLVPPPPSSDDEPAAKGKHGNGVVGKIKEKLVPPPPPVEAANLGGGSSGISIEELPVPPSKPIIGNQMKIIAVMDDKAVVSFPSSLRSKNKWPKYMTLSSGQQFESITLVNISKDGVTIEEDGERSLKPIPNVK